MQGGARGSQIGPLQAAGRGLEETAQGASRSGPLPSVGASCTASMYLSRMIPDVVSSACDASGFGS